MILHSQEPALQPRPAMTGGIPVTGRRETRRSPYVANRIAARWCETMNNTEKLDDETRKFVRRHFEALQEAGLTSWTFAEFAAFCAPLTLRNAPSAIEDATCTTAGKLADAIDELLHTRHGHSLNARTRRNIVRTAERILIANRRKRVRLSRRGAP